MEKRREEMMRRLENAKVGDVILGYKPNDSVWITGRTENHRRGYRMKTICSVFKDGVLTVEALFPLSDTTMKMVLDSLERY